MFFALFLSLGYVNDLLGQAANVTINGTIKDEDEGGKIDGAAVVIFKNGGQFQTVTVTGGKFKVELPIGFNYDLKFTKDFYAPKIARLDTRNVPREDNSGGYEFNMEVSLFKAPPGFNIDIMKEPAAKAHYVAESDKIDWDTAYILKQKEKIDAERKRVENLAKADATRRKEFEKIIKEGDEKVITKEYSSAIAKYEQAQAMYPTDPLPKEKIDKVNALIAADQNSKKADAQYAVLLVEGDNAMASKQWEVARAKYNEAKKMKPNEKVPVEKLAELEKRMANATLFAKYDSLIRDADNLLSAGRYDECIGKYKDASNIFPKETYPKEQIAKANDLKAKNKMDAEALKKREARYNELMANGEKFLVKKEYESALNNFTEASTVKPEEQLPKNKIEECKRLIEEQKNALLAKDQQAKNDAEMAKKRKEYDAIIKMADAQFKDSKQTDLAKLMQSKEFYNQALVILPSEAYPKSQNSIIDGLIDSIKKNMDSAELERQQKEAERLRLEAERKRKLAEQEEAALAEKRRREEEAAAKKNSKSGLADNNRSERSVLSGSTAEEALDAFYRDARRQRNQVIADSVARVKTNFNRFDSTFHDRALTRDDQANMELWKQEVNEFNSIQRLRAEKRIEEDKDQQKEQRELNAGLDEKGKAWVTRRRLDSDASAEAFRNEQSELIIHGEQLRSQRQEESESFKKAMANQTVNDLFRQSLINGLDRSRNLYAENETASKQRADLRLQANERTRQLQKDNAAAFIKLGEEIHNQEVQEILANQENYQEELNFWADGLKARSQVAESEVDEKKQSLNEWEKDTNEHRQQRMIDIGDRRFQTETMLVDRKSMADEKSFDKRNELFDRATPMEQKKKEAMEEVGIDVNEESITERSYDLGKKKVLERTLKLDGKVYVYRKIVSTTGVYYFKNGISITEQMWKDETTSRMTE